MMKLYIIVFTILGLSMSIYGQDTLRDTIITYYNYDWIKTDSGTTKIKIDATELNAKYYKVAFPSENNEKWIVENYHINKIIISSKSYLNKELEIKDGPCYEYHNNGQISSEGHYSNDNKVGEWANFYRNGENIGLKYYDEHGNRTGHWLTYYKNGNLYSDVNYLEDHYTGVCKWFYHNGEIASEETYSDTGMVDYKIFDVKGKAIKGKYEVESDPEYPGGINSLVKFLGANIEYPTKAQKSGIEGRVVLRFVVNEVGEIERISVLKSVGGGCTEEAIRVVKKMPKWTPGKQHNLPVKVYYTLPVKFSLQ